MEEDEQVRQKIHAGNLANICSRGRLKDRAISVDRRWGGNLLNIGTLLGFN
jgi:hypothetical protein